MNQRSRVALGTAQFGMAYGVSHDGGRVPLREAKAIIALAADSGVDMLDTAAAYGDAEDVLGEIAGEETRFAVVTKTTPIRAETIDTAAIDRVEAGVRSSLQRLRRKSVYALLVHDARDILNPGGERLWSRLEAFRDEGLAEKIGVSAYDRAEIDAVVSRFAAAIVQAPVSVFDQRLVRDGTLARLAAGGVEVHARSALLQGLLLMTPEAVAARAPPALQRLRDWRSALAELRLSPLAAALGFVMTQPAIERVVVGVHSAAHLAECLAAARTPPLLDYARLACDDPDIIDPRRWTSWRP
jgi:aryl-alcohol dehydrogenase-like predicted oxidoreductase